MKNLNRKELLLRESILKDFDKVFSIKDNVWGKAKYGSGNTIYQPSKVKQFISSALDKQHKADMEEVIMIAEDMAGKTNVELESDGIDDGIGYFVALKSLINTLKEKV